MIWVIAGLWLLGFVLLWRVPLCRSGVAPADFPSVSVIIPARNEEKNIARLLHSIRGQFHAPLEVLVVDDASEDRTAEIASAAGATVLSAPFLPDGWRGKNWSCWCGASHARGDVILFLDADTVLNPLAIHRMLSVMKQRDVDALTLAPYHDVRRPYEQLSAMFNLMMVAGIGAFSLFGSPSRPAGLFGPVVMIKRDVYEATGGHEAVKGEILDQMAFGGVLRSCGKKLLCLGGRDTVHVRMYPDGWRSMVEGWTKAFASGASGSGRLELLLSVAWITGGMLAWIMVVVAAVSVYPVAPFILLYAMFALQTYGLLRRIGSFHPLASAMYPVLLLFFFVVFFSSALRRRRGANVHWKGRVIKSVEDVDAP